MKSRDLEKLVSDTQTERTALTERIHDAQARLARALGCLEARAVRDRYAGRRRLVKLLRDEGEHVAAQLPVEPVAVIFSARAPLADRLEVLADAAETLATKWDREGAR